MSNIIIYTDGASRGNPGPGGYGLIIIHNDKVKEFGGRKDLTTNNEMELKAVIEAIKNTPKDSVIEIHSDSAYVVNGITKWIYSWIKNNWRTSTDTEVANKELWQELFELTKGLRIKWEKVAGHVGVPGNERADVIATSFADQSEISLYDGSLSDYKFLTTHSPTKSNLYISIVDGIVEEHDNWESCKDRVEGISGAKYKKVKTEKEKEEFIKENS